MNTIQFCPECHNVLKPNIVRIGMGWGMQYTCEHCGYNNFHKSIKYSYTTEPYERKN